MNGSDSGLPTVWILGDQLNRSSGALKDRNPGDCRILLVQSIGKAKSKRSNPEGEMLLLKQLVDL